jgi:hypothetical protein
MNVKVAERALRVIWKLIAKCTRDGKRPTKDDMLRIMGWCAGGLGVDPATLTKDDLKDE